MWAWGTEAVNNWFYTDPSYRLELMKDWSKKLLLTIWKKTFTFWIRLVWWVISLMFISSDTATTEQEQEHANMHANNIIKQKEVEIKWHFQDWLYQNMAIVRNCKLSEEARAEAHIKAQLLKNEIWEMDITRDNRNYRNYLNSIQLELNNKWLLCKKEWDWVTNEEMYILRYNGRIPFNSIVVRNWESIQDAFNRLSNILWKKILIPNWVNSINKDSIITYYPDKNQINIIKNPKRNYTPSQ